MGSFLFTKLVNAFFVLILVFSEYWIIIEWYKFYISIFFLFLYSSKAKKPIRNKIIIITIESNIFLFFIKKLLILSIRVFVLIAAKSSSIIKSSFEGHIEVCRRFYNILIHFLYLFYKVYLFFLYLQISI